MGAMAAQAFPPPPVSWPLTHATSGTVGVAGAFFGIMAGLVLLFHRTHFTRGGVVEASPALRWAAGVVILWLGLRQSLARDASLIAQVLRYLRYAVTGFLIGYGAPWLFVKPKL
jgi:hypothetical protein